jgi:hypothetical protein
MNVVEAALRQVASDFSHLDQLWALVGGFAVSARAEPRFTRDVDLAVAVADDDGAEQIVRSLFASGYRLVASVEQDTTGRLATARLVPAADSPQADVVVDLLFASSGIEPEIVAAAEPLEILPDLVVRVAQVGHLIAVKLLARDDVTRPQDLMDLRSLIAVATTADLDCAREAVALITARGFERDRDLIAALSAVVAEK